MSSPMPEANLLYNRKKSDSVLDFFKLCADLCNSDLRIIHQKHASHHECVRFPKSQRLNTIGLLVSHKKFKKGVHGSQGGFHLVMKRPWLLVSEPALGFSWCN